jgi:hypothetical protein
MQIMPNLLQNAPRATAIPDPENWRDLPQIWRSLHSAPPCFRAKLATSAGPRSLVLVLAIEGERWKRELNVALF